MSNSFVQIHFSWQYSNGIRGTIGFELSRIFIQMLKPLILEAILPLRRFKLTGMKIWQEISTDVLHCCFEEHSWRRSNSHKSVQSIFNDQKIGFTGFRGMFKVRGECCRHVCFMVDVLL